MNIKPGDYFVLSPTAADQTEYRRRFAGVVFEAVNMVGPLVAAKAVAGPLHYVPLLQHVDTTKFEPYIISRTYVLELIAKQGAKS